MVDEPLHFQGGLTKRSYFNKDGRVTINDKQALMHSSNVFMFKTALKLAGDPYYSGMPYLMTLQRQVKSYEKD